MTSLNKSLCTTVLHHKLSNHDWYSHDETDSISLCDFLRNFQGVNPPFVSHRYLDIFHVVYYRKLFLSHKQGVDIGDGRGISHLGFQSIPNPHRTFYLNKLMTKTILRDTQASVV